MHQFKQNVNATNAVCKYLSVESISHANNCHFTNNCRLSLTILGLSLLHNHNLFGLVHLLGLDVQYEIVNRLLVIG